MGFLSDISDTIFGGSNDEALKSQRKDNRRAQEYIEEQTQLALEDIANVYPQGDDFRNRSYELAMYLTGMAVPQQMRMFQQGNVGAQGQLLAGMPQFQNAILGLPYDNSALQPMAIRPPQMPQFGQQLPQTPAWLLGGGQ